VPFDNVISRTDVQAAIPEQVSNEILTNLTSNSAAMTLFRQIPMATSQTRMPVLAALPTAYFVNGDTGLKQTTEAGWANKYLQAEEIAAIVPIPEAVLDDASFDVWGSIRPLIEQAVGRTLDAAVFFGVNKPGSWPEAIAPAALAAGHAVTRGTAPQNQGGISGDFSNLFSAVEADGFDVNGLVASTAYRGLLRNARDTQGRPLLDQQTGVYGVNVQYPMRGLWPTGAASVEAIAGDFTQGILGVRQDITYKLLDQAVITDNTGAIVYNLAQQDMVALRVVARFGFQVANTLNYDNPDVATRFPFAVMRGA